MTKQQALDQLRIMQAWHEDNGNGPCPDYDAICYAINIIEEMPEIIRCKDCKHWTQSTGKMTGYGLGRCDFHDADLVACNGFCYWAERRTDEAD